MRCAKTLLATAAVLFALGQANRAEAGSQTCLETVGGMSAGYLYNTYLVIGLTGDAFAKGAYDKAKVKQLMLEQIRLIDNALKQLGKLMKGGLSADDKRYIRDINATLQLLKKQAQALSAFASNGSNKNAQKFESARKKSWAKIAKLLGLANYLLTPILPDQGMEGTVAMSRCPTAHHKVNRARAVDGRLQQTYCGERFQTKM